MIRRIGRDGGPSRANEIEGWHDISANWWSLMSLQSDALAAVGVTTTELRILEVIDLMGDAGISEIATNTHMRVSTVSRQVTRLISTGTLERLPNGSDARQRVVRLTDAGRESLTGYCDVRDALIRRHVIEVLDEDEYRVVVDAFRKIGDSI